MNNNWQEKVKFLEKVIAKMPGLVYCKDTQGVYLGCNEAQANILGQSTPNEVIGKTDFDYLKNEDAEKLRKNDELVTSGKLVMDINNPIEEHVILPDGKDATFESVKIPLYDDNGKTIGLVGISKDITELKVAQEREKQAIMKASAEEAISHALLVFSGMATHDLRTPLSSINLRAALLKKYLPVLIETYNMALKAGLEISHIHNKVIADLEHAPDDILQAFREANIYIDSSLKSIKVASQGEESLEESQLVKCNSGKLLDRIVSRYPCKEGQEGLLHLNNDCDFDFMGNEIYFTRLIENLIKNSFEQIQLKGKGEIFISCEAGDIINKIKIKDTAGDVTENIINEIFNGIHSSKIGGTGIGLTSAKKIMKAFGGDISCELADQNNIEFTLSFPKISS